MKNLQSVWSIDVNTTPIGELVEFLETHGLCLVVSGDQRTAVIVKEEEQ